MTEKIEDLRGELLRLADRIRDEGNSAATIYGTTIERTMRDAATALAVLSAPQELCSVTPGGRPCENSKPGHQVHWSNGPAPQEAKSVAKVVPVSYEASASCSHGVCPTGCSHLMWACSACYCEGGWGASRERLEELAAQHECPPAWSDGDVTDPAFEALEQELWKHQPVLSMEDGSIRGCQCLDRVFYRGTEDWGTHLAEVFQVLSRAAAPEEVEWEYQCNRGGVYGMNVPVDDPEQHRFVCNEPRLERRRKAGPWLPVGGND